MVRDFSFVIAGWQQGLEKSYITAAQLVQVVQSKLTLADQKIADKSQFSGQFFEHHFRMHVVKCVKKIADKLTLADNFRVTEVVR